MMSVLFPFNKIEKSLLPRQISLSLGGILCGCFLVNVNNSYAEFVLDFTSKGSPHGAYTWNPGTFKTEVMHSGRDPLITDQTRYLMRPDYEIPEMVRDPDNGKLYYHIVVGDQADGFIQEVFIEVRAADYGYNTLYSAPAMTADFGQSTVVLPGSASGGTDVDVVMFGNVTNQPVMDSNGHRPLDAGSGSGTGDPNRVIMRQLVSDGEIMMEFIKDKYDRKPRVTQLLNVPGDITQVFEVDMSNLTYQQDSEAARYLVNQMWLWGGDAPPDGGGFDATSPVDVTRWNVSSNAGVVGTGYSNAGKFRYDAFVDGNGNQVWESGAGGAYSYADGGGMNLEQDWGAFFDDTPGVNPWAYESGKP